LFFGFGCFKLQSPVIEQIINNGTIKMLNEKIKIQFAQQIFGLIQSIKSLLSLTSKTNPQSIKTDRSEFLDLFGTWSESDVKEFEETTKEFEYF
jgi:hypothetical protein